MALITTLAELRLSLPVGYAKSAMLPAFDHAEQTYLLPILGDALYNALVTAYEGNNLSAQQARLVNKCRAVIAPFAYASNLPFMQTTLTDNGLIALEAENQRKAFQWEYTMATEELKDRGYAAQEALITFLKANASDYTDWTSSPYNANTNFGLVRDGSDLGSVIGLLQPQRTYSLVKPLFRMVQDLYLSQAIGSSFFEAFNTRILAGTTTPEDKTLFALLQPAAARLVMQLAGLELSVRFGENGFTVVDGSKIKDSPDAALKGVSQVQLQNFIDQMSSTAQHYLANAISYLNATASGTIFPEYYTSGLYVSPTYVPGVRRNNDKLKGFFVAG